jgi:hypothetical protein
MSDSFRGQITHWRPEGPLHIGTGFVSAARAILIRILIRILNRILCRSQHSEYSESTKDSIKDPTKDSTKVGIGRWDSVDGAGSGRSRRDSALLARNSAEQFDHPLRRLRRRGFRRLSAEIGATQFLEAFVGLGMAAVSGLAIPFAGLEQITSGAPAIAV